ncbi:MAG TPA: hypothetical protein VK470_10060 [Bacteroidota bacterium]|nr:hypothetical protein [Bacteroidota bacterium]
MKRKFSLILILLSCFLVSASSHAQTASQIVRNVKQRFDQVKDYTVSITASVNMERMKIPEMKATLYFKQPDKFHVESKNFSMLPKEGMSLNPSEMLEKFDASLIKSEKRNNTMFYNLRLISKPEKGKQVREYFVTVNGDLWVVSHIESFPMPGRKISIDFTHTLVADQYWLPSSLSIDYTTQTPSDSSEGEAAQPPQGRGRMTPRSGSARVQYSDYKVNTGLSDSIFEKKKEEKK